LDEDEDEEDEEEGREGALPRQLTLPQLPLSELD
jgi:hypothetical protein